MPKCKKCGSDKVLSEGQGDGKTKVTCQACGESAVMDTQGRRLLTDDMNTPGQAQLLTEAS